jgi:uncharacterized protein (DUF2164 family)
MKSSFKLDKDKRNRMELKIKEYFSKERDEEIGDLAASMILDFFLKELAPEIYNQGINDSYAYLSYKLEDMLGLQR